MFIRSLRGAGVAVFLASLMWAQAGPDGHWEGAFTADNRQIGLSLDLAKNDKSAWIASMGVPINDVRQTGQKVEFGLKIAQSSFQGTLNKEGTELTGQWIHEADSLP